MDEILYWIGQGFGIVAVVLGFINYQVKTREQVLYVHIATTVVFAIHFALLGEYPTAIMQLRSRVNHPVIRNGITALSVAFILFMVVCRLLAGVHWLTDIVGGILLSAGLVMMYDSIMGGKNHE